MRATGLLLAALLLSGNAIAGQDQLQSFRDKTKEAWALCSWKANIAGTVFGDEAHFRETISCVNELLSTASAAYKSANQSAQQAVRPYYAKWIASMKSLPALQASSKIEIERSISDSSKALEEAWALIELDHQQ
ncbi:hypothetical protein D9M69_503330 [compost metagenome]